MKINIVKIGGKILAEPAWWPDFFQAFGQVPGKKILVHGGGRNADKLAKALGIPVQMIEGRRITDQAMLSLVTMAYAGLNKELVAGLQGRRIAAIGLCGADLGIIPARKRRHPSIDFGFVGDIRKEDIGVNALLSLLDSAWTPVLAPLSFHPEIGLLNTNADTIAAEIALALHAHADVELSYCIEHPGVMGDLDDPASLLPEINLRTREQMAAEGLIAAGMLPKLDNALRCAASGIELVRICSFKNISGGTLVIP